MQTKPTPRDAHRTQCTAPTGATEAQHRHDDQHKCQQTTQQAHEYAHLLSEHTLPSAHAKRHSERNKAMRCSNLSPFPQGIQSATHSNSNDAFIIKYMQADRGCTATLARKQQQQQQQTNLHWLVATNTGSANRNLQPGHAAASNHSC
jgi:hypothetical protein